MPTQTDLVVIGAGPGGYAAAFYAADLGMDVTLIDREAESRRRLRLPRLHPVEGAAARRQGDRRSARTPRPGASTSARRRSISTSSAAFKDDVVGAAHQRHRAARQGTQDQVPPRHRDAVGPTSLEVALLDGGSEQVTFGHAIIAVGSQPAKVPGLSLDSPRFMDSTGASNLENVPKSLLVVGGGYIGLELGSVYAALGSKVTVVEMMPGLLPGADRDLVAVLAKSIDKVFDAVLLETKVVGVKEQKDGIRVTFEDAGSAPGAIRSSTRCWCRWAGSRTRWPASTRRRSKPISAGSSRSMRRRQTAEPTLYAIGDIAGDPMLAHKASHEGRVAVEAILGEDVVFEPAAIPAVVFTDPELAWTGLTETEAQKLGRKVEISKFPWAASGRSLSIDRTDGLTKLVIEPGSERVLGVGIVGPGAGELIAEGTLAIEMGAVVSDLKLTIHAHPTLSETVMEWAETFFGHATHIYRPKRK